MAQLAQPAGVLLHAGKDRCQATGPTVFGRLGYASRRKELGDAEGA
jgi:hypothetical protein